MEAHIYGPSIYDPDNKSEQRKRAVFSANGIEATEHPYRKKKNGHPTAPYVQNTIPGEL